MAFVGIGPRLRRALVRGAGLILLDGEGNLGFAHSTSRMAFGYVARDRAPWIAMQA